VGGCADATGGRGELEEGRLRPMRVRATPAFCCHASTLASPPSSSRPSTPRSFPSSMSCLATPGRSMPSPAVPSLVASSVYNDRQLRSPDFPDATKPCYGWEQARAGRFGWRYVLFDLFCLPRCAHFHSRPSFLPLRVIHCVFSCDPLSTRACIEFNIQAAYGCAMMTLWPEPPYCILSCDVLFSAFLCTLFVNSFFCSRLFGRSSGGGCKLSSRAAHERTLTSTCRSTSPVKTHPP